MRTRFDWTPYRRATVGYDRLFDFFEQSAQAADSYPPYDVEKLDEDRYRITLAVAGFKREDISITAQQNSLLIGARKAESDTNDNRQMLHSGIATRAFERRFQLADYVTVQSADLADGLLTIDLLREVPDAVKPRTIEIGAGTVEGALIDGKKNKAA
jgi:molecular chaperone IbpA